MDNEILQEISNNLQRGKAKVVKELVQQALDAGIDPETILREGMLSGMNIIGEKFKNNEVYVPEVLVAARAMNMGTQVLKPALEASGVKATGKACIGTVQGDLHDIGKNLVIMMLEGAGFEVINGGVDVAPEKIVEDVKKLHPDIIGMSALLTTTMLHMKDTIELLKEEGLRDQVKVIIGGAPVSQDFADEIAADGYSPDAVSAADLAKSLVGAA